MAFIHQFAETPMPTRERSITMGTQTLTEVRREQPDTDPHKHYGFIPLTEDNQDWWAMGTTTFRKGNGGGRDEDDGKSCGSIIPIAQ